MFPDGIRFHFGYLFMLLMDTLCWCNDYLVEPIEQHIYWQHKRFIIEQDIQFIYIKF